MSKVHMIDEFDQFQTQTKSISKLEALDESFIQYKSPVFQNKKLGDQDREMAYKNIILKIMEMELDVELAEQILKNVSDEEFKDENQVLQKLISAVLILNPLDYRNQVVQKQQLNDFRELMGSISPNLMSYLGYNSVKSSQNLLNQICGICMSPLNDDILPEMGCEHNFCLSCMKEYLTNNIINGQIEQMICPEQYCNQSLSDEYISQIVEQELMNKLQRFRKIKELQLDPDIIWCPKIGCEETVRKNGSKKLQCVCGQQICRKCGREKHKGFSCKDQIDKDFKSAIKKLRIQKCQNCKSPIQKSEGCNHMTCKTCQYEFCWLCRSKYSSLHYSSYNIFGCPGMQFTNRDPFRYPNLYRIICILLILIFGPPLLLVGLILGFIILVIGLPAILYMNYVPYHQFEEYSCCKQISITMFLFISCLLMSPISLLLVILGIIVGIIVGIPYCIYLFIDWLRYR